MSDGQSGFGCTGCAPCVSMGVDWIGGCYCRYSTCCRLRRPVEAPRGGKGVDEEERELKETRFSPCPLSVPTLRAPLRSPPRPCLTPKHHCLDSRWHAANQQNTGHGRVVEAGMAVVRSLHAPHRFSSSLCVPFSPSRMRIPTHTCNTITLHVLHSSLTIL